MRSILKDVDPASHEQLVGGTSRAGVRDAELHLRPGILFASIVALLSFTLEIELVEKIDGLSCYLRWSEIALEAGVALLGVIGLSFLLWLCAVLVAGIARPSVHAGRGLLAIWSFALALPFSYFVVDNFGLVRLLWFAHRHLGFVPWVALFTGVLVASTVGLRALGVARAQKFCRLRLAPVGWFHLAAAVVAVVVLRTNGVYLFHDYAHAGRTGVAVHSPDIYLITFDALRAEDMSVYGYERDTTPNLRRFAQRSYTFEYFLANSNFTAPTTASIETGKLPWSHRVFQGGGFLRGAARGENLAELLHQRGYYTVSITSNYVAAPFHHRTLGSYDAVEYLPPADLTGTWLRYTNLIGVNTQNTFLVSLFERLGRVRFYLDALMLRGRYPSPPEQVFSQARSLLDRSDISQPRFVWAHILPPHDPYWPPPGFRQRFLSTNALTSYDDFLRMSNDRLPPGVSSAELRARYDEMVLYADHTVGEFLDWLDQTGRLENSVVLISADHGESFEHGWYFHTGPYLYNELIRIPLLVHLPGQRQGARVSAIAQQADLLPTILDLIGDKAPAWTDGVSLRPTMEGAVLPRRFLYSMNLEPDRVFDPISKGSLAIIDNDFKYVRYLNSGREELYRYQTDPEEKSNLIASEPEVAGRLRDALLAKLKEVNQRQSSQP